MKLSTVFTVLTGLTVASGQSLASTISCDTGPRDATLQSASAKNHMLSCVNSLDKGLTPFKVGNFNGIRCGRDWHMYKQGDYFKTNADCLKGCGSCLRLQAQEGRRTGYCSYYPDQKKWPSTMCIVGWNAVNGQVCAVPK
ncbi:hypothetical protein EDC01DRAFT_385826 [Geopyxis carbonaria]|nr:hypothetical protein EDC01DRAFT_385826 [Geopyxis carbonaria]